MDKTALIQAALDARKAAYAPYSHFQVGAALLTEELGIVTGVNIENASYGATNCAERTAVFKAVSEGARHFKGIAIAGGMEGGSIEEYAFPCGICRQVLQGVLRRRFSDYCGKKHRRLQGVPVKGAASLWVWRRIY